MPLFTEILTLCANSPLSSVYQYNTPDFTKPKQGKSVFKDMHRFHKNETNKDRGSNGGQGEYFKDKKAGLQSHYYLADRMVYREYFIYELLNAIGLHVPKTRLISSDDKFYVATSSISGFIPIRLLMRIKTDDSNYLATDYDSVFNSRSGSSKKSESGLEQYHFSTRLQTIVSDVTGEHFPIRGSLPASKIIADFLQDGDGIEGTGDNAGFLMKEHAFEFVLIDKQSAHWMPNKPKREQLNFPYDKSPYSATATGDQKLAMLYQLANIFVERNGERIIDKIYFNPRSASVLKQNMALSAVYPALYGLNTAASKEWPVKNQETFFKALIPRLIAKAKSIVETFPAEIKRNEMEQLSQVLTKGIFAEMELVVKENKFHENVLQAVKKGQEECSWQVNCLEEIAAMEKHVAYLFEANKVTLEQFSGYITREKLREQIATTVSALFVMTDIPTQKLLIRNICEDLRGVRFVSHYHEKQTGEISEKDLENDALIEALSTAFAKEFSLTKIAEAESSTQLSRGV